MCKNVMNSIDRKLMYFNNRKLKSRTVALSVAIYHLIDANLDCR